MMLVLVVAAGHLAIGRISTASRLWFLTILVLRLPQGESVVMNMPLSPASVIAMSLELMLGGGLHLGVFEHSTTLMLLILFTLLSFKLTYLLCLEVPHLQVQN